MKTIQTTDSKLLPYPLPRIWQAISDLATYSAWWPARIGIKTLLVTDGLIGSRMEVRPHGGPAFYCEVADLKEGKELSLKYTGIYEGTGTWTISEMNGMSRVSYAIDLKIQSLTIRLLATVLPVASIHSKLMVPVLDGLEQYLAKMDSSRK